MRLPQISEKTTTGKTMQKDVILRSLVDRAPFTKSGETVEMDIALPMARVDA